MGNPALTHSKNQFRCCEASRCELAMQGDSGYYLENSSQAKPTFFLQKQKKKIFLRVMFFLMKEKSKSCIIFKWIKMR